MVVADCSHSRTTEQNVLSSCESERNHEYERVVEKRHIVAIQS